MHGGFLQKVSSMQGGSPDTLECLSAGHAQINATDARKSVTKHSSAISLRFAGDVPRRAIITVAAMKLY